MIRRAMLLCAILLAVGPGCTGPLRRDLARREIQGRWGIVTVHRDLYRIDSLAARPPVEVEMTPSVPGEIAPPSAVAPGARRIAVVADPDETDVGTLEIRLADGRVAHRYDRVRVHGWDMTFDAEGRRLAFFGRVEDRVGLHVLELGSGRIRSLPVGEGRAPTFDPEGERIAFEADGACRVVAVDGEGPAEVLVRGAGSPAWSPDGRWIAVLGGEGPSAGGGTELLLVEPSGRSGRRLVAFASGVPTRRPPVWAPDGSSLALTRGRADPPGTYDFIVVPLEGSMGEVGSLRAPGGRFEWVADIGPARGADGEPESPGRSEPGDAH